METYLPLFKTIFADWVQLTINEPLYAGTLALIAWLLSACLYNIKIAFLNRQSTARENARIDAINQLSSAQLQMQDMQQKLIENSEQIKKDQEWSKNETGRAAKLEDQLQDRNKQIAAIIQSFSTSFDLGERPLPLTEDLKAESLWQQFDRTIHLLITRLRNEQETKAELQIALKAETLKSTENEAAISRLQSGIAAQTIKIANLERLLEEQTYTLQQQDHAQLVLEQSLVNKQVEVVQNNKETISFSVDSEPSNNEPLTTAPPEIIASTDLISEPLPTTITSTTKPTLSEEITALPPIKSSKNQLGKFKNLFEKTLKKKAITTPEIITGQQTDSVIQQVQLEIAPEPAAIKLSKSPLKKMKYYFGEAKQITETKLDITEAASAPLVTEPEPNSSAKLSFGKLKSLISKLP
ncbi:MAG: hypothetical protein D0530_09840 [Methylococcales bacterium]|jgi:hypothetical protein|nr:MAG: hypothetical protein D0530_09840 [Methylococcales bacterium]